MSKDEIKILALKVLDDTFVMSLGTADANGVWVSDVTFIHDEHLNLYWLSLPKTRHSKAIETNHKVACTITASWKTGAERALQVEGVAEVVLNIPLEFEQKLEKKRGKEMPKVAGEVLKKGHSWYILKPTKIEVMNSELFGYEKKSLEL